MEHAPLFWKVMALVAVFFGPTALVGVATHIFDRIRNRRALRPWWEG